MKRTLAVGLFVSMLLVAGAGVAGADPVGEAFEVTCTNGIPDGSVVAPPNEATWAPGLKVEGTGVYILNYVRYSTTFTPDVGDPVVWEDVEFTKNAPKNTRSHLHGTCSFGGELPYEDPDLGTGTLVFEAEARVFWTGKQ